jgi:hypothetical protein
MTAMIGRIEYRLDLSAQSSDFTKKRRQGQQAATSSSHDERKLSDAGIYFVDESSYREHLLVVPASLAKTVCDAARYQCQVRIAPPWTRMELLSTNTVSTTSRGQGFVLEIQNLELMDLVDSLPPWDTSNTITLTEWRDEELESTTDSQSSSAESNLMATVDAISPIIAVVPQDPFCLIELYHENVDTAEAGTASSYVVVVVKGQAALACHAGIHPGDVLQLVRSRTKRQRWTVPEALRTTYPDMRVPARVLVVSDPMAIVWNQAAEDLPPTVPISMSIVEGIVSRVIETAAGLQSIELTDRGNDSASGDTTGDRVVLLLSHYPMSTNMQYGLRRGALVRATNVHYITSYTAESPSSSSVVKYYGACLRSSFSLLRPASNGTKRSADSNNSVTTAMHVKESAIPWKYGRVRTSVFYQALLCHVKDNNQYLKQVKSLSEKALVAGLLTMFRLPHHEGGMSSCHPWALRSETVASNSKRRDQFAEFLDHGLENDENDISAPAISSCGCHMSHVQPSLLPIIVTISQVKEAIFKVLRERLKDWVNSIPAGTKVQGGSVASVQLDNQDMIAAIMGSISGGRDGFLCIVGNLSSMGESQKAFYLGDSTCCCPITAKKTYSFQGGSGLQSVVGSASVCLGSALCLSSTAVLPVDEDNPMPGAPPLPFISLEPWATDAQSPKEGSCAVLDCCGNMFLVSVHIHFEAIAAANEKELLETVVKEAMASSVQQMLDPEHAIQKDEFFGGILCRQRLKFAKIKSGSFNGTMLTLAHRSSPESSELDVSCVSTLQSLELNISSRIPDRKKVTLVKCIQSLFHESLLSEQVNLAAAWWKMSDGSSSALVACGVDEILKTKPEFHQLASSRFVPCVIAPSSARREGSNGFIRFKCELDDLRVSLVEVKNVPFPDLNYGSSALHGLGGQKHLQGMLDKLPYRRRSLKQEETSELPGIQSTTLGDMHRAICADIRHCSQIRLAPTMVRRVRGARLLAVAYCRVQVECSRCYKPLVRRSKGGAKTLSGVVDSIQADPQPSFWNTQIRLDGTVAPQKDMTRQSLLRCPNHCPDNCSEVKWECSGILDDGTGQGKLYSERESALLLLGIASETVSSIEDGAWESESGIYYQKAMPPSSYIKEAIREARILVSQQRRGKRASAVEILRLLKPAARASYLLHQQCASLPRVQRNVDFFVRCKPLSTAAFHLNRTEVETTTSEAFTRESAVYSLPPLKLSLVDMV